MIPFEKANEFIRELNNKELIKFTDNRLRGLGATVYSSPHADERPEDVIVSLLRSGHLESSKREAIIRACLLIYKELFDVLCVGEVLGIQQKDVFTRISRVTDITSPLELGTQAFSALDFALEYYREDIEILDPAARACMGYTDRKGKLDTWRNAIKTHPDIAAYAYNAMLKMGISVHGAKVHLLFLWEKQIGAGWKIDMAFLMRRTDRQFPAYGITKDVLAELQESDVWKGIKKEIERRAWSKEWLSHLTENSKGNELELEPKEEHRIPYKGTSFNYKEEYEDGKCIQTACFRSDQRGNEEEQAHFSLFARNFDDVYGKHAETKLTEVQYV